MNEFDLFELLGDALRPHKFNEEKEIEEEVKQ